MDRPVDQALFLEVSQRFGQHLVGNIGHHSPQLVEAAHFDVEEVKADQAPFAADGDERGRHRALRHRRRAFAGIHGLQAGHDELRLPEGASLP